MFSKSTGRNGTRYAYFVCRRRTEGLCDLPAMPVETVEEAIVEHYRTLELPANFVAETRAMLKAVMDDESVSTRRMHASLERQLKELDKKESRLIDLIADSAMPQAKVR
ncbi:hypothetical protein [Nocardia sp. NBC_01327]|uniref:hypothetical protein n=1 Tax=Nocardia sp. NBC_01327 TaxID=2903593 RepID=UPI002E0E33EC|nr:hypothetical protein OG326_34380 [Nocardia sp. NBC_01327]